MSYDNMYVNGVLSSFSIWTILNNLGKVCKYEVKNELIVENKGTSRIKIPIGNDNLTTKEIHKPQAAI